MNGAVRRLTLVLLGAVVSTLVPIKLVPPMPASWRGHVVLSTTTSLQDTGLLGVLVPMFEERTGYRVKTVATAGGQALTVGARGEADVVFAHAPARGDGSAPDGWLLRRRPVMYDELVIVGPSDDPARIRGMTTAADAMRAIAQRRAQFVSRADDSGIHVVERGVWKRAGIDPRGEWYVEAQQGMGGTLGLAGAWSAYTLTDRSTYLAWRRRVRLPILVDGGRSLRKVYCVLEVNPGTSPGIDQVAGRAFADFLLSDDAQDVIGAFGRGTYGEPLFVPVAGLVDADVTEEGD